MYTEIHSNLLEKLPRMHLVERMRDCEYIDITGPINHVELEWNFFGLSIWQWCLEHRESEQLSN